LTSENRNWLLELLDSATTPEEVEALEELIAEEERGRQADQPQPPGEPLTAVKAAEALGVSPRTIEKYYQRGCPRDSPEAIRQWRDENIGAVSRDAESSELALEKTRADLADRLEAARSRRLKNDQLEGRLLEREQVEREISVTVGRLRNRLQGLGMQCANLAPTELKPVIKQLVDEQVRTCLKELADGFANDSLFRETDSQ
jgi:hypothetical protein